MYKVGELCHYTMEASTIKGKILIRNSYNLWARLARVKAINEVTLLNLESNRKAMNRKWSNQKENPALKTNAGNK